MAPIEKEFPRLIANVGNNAYIAVNKLFSIQYANSAFCELSGFTLQELQGTNLSDIFYENPSLFIDEDLPLNKTSICTLVRQSGERQVCVIKMLGYDKKTGLYVCSLENASVFNKDAAYIRRMISAIELSPVSILITDDKALISYVNPGFEEMTGYSFDEIIGKNISILKSPETPESVYRDLWETLSRGEVWKGDINNKRKDGELYWESATISPIPDVAGAPVYYMKIAVNISKQKRMLDLLLGSYEFIENVMNSISPVFVLDEDETFILINQPFSVQTGYKTTDIISKHVSEIFNEETSQRIKGLVDSAGKSKNDSFETYYLNSDGDYRILFLKLSTLMVAEGKIQIVGSFEDISDRKRTEEERNKLSRAVEQSPASVLITDIDGSIEYVNPKFTKLTGYTFKEAVGKNPSILKSGQQDKNFYKDLWKTILQGKEWRGEFHNKKKNGELYWEFASISPYRNREGEVTHFVAVKEDITERKKAEEALKISEESLREKNTSMLKELQYAQIAVRNMLPQSSIITEGIKSSFRYIPLDAVGGDYVNFFDLGNGDHGVFIGDVAGHGVSAALYLALVKSSIDRQILDYGREPAKMLEKVNSELSSSLSSYFFTAIYGYFKQYEDSIEFKFARAGHCPPIVHDLNENTSKLIISKGKPIGLFETIAIEDKSIFLNSDKRLFLFTDGLHETMNGEKIMLDFDGLIKFIEETSEYELEKSLDAVISKVNKYRGNAPEEDDIILLGFEFPPKNN